MSKFVQCCCCERTINIEEDNHTKYDVEALNLGFTLYFCLDCVDELIEQSKMLEGENE